VIADNDVGNVGAPVGATGPKTMQDGSSGCAEGEHPNESGTAENTGIHWENQGVLQQPPPGLEPGTCGLQRRHVGFFHAILLRKTAFFGVLGPALCQLTASGRLTTTQSHADRGRTSGHTSAS